MVDIPMTTGRLLAAALVGLGALGAGQGAVVIKRDDYAGEPSLRVDDGGKRSHWGGHEGRFGSAVAKRRAKNKVAAKARAKNRR